MLAVERPLPSRSPRRWARYMARRRAAVAWVQDAADRLARLSPGRSSGPALGS